MTTETFAARGYITETRETVYVTGQTLEDVKAQLFGKAYAVDHGSVTYYKIKGETK